MKLLTILTCVILCHPALAVKQKYADNTTVNNHLIWPTMSPMAKEKLRQAVDQGAISMVISTNEMQTLIDTTSKYFTRVTMGGTSKAKILHANVKNWMDIIGKLKNYTYGIKKSDAYFKEKQQAFDTYIQQLIDLSKYLKKLRYNADYVSSFLYKLYALDRLTFKQVGEFIQDLKKNYSPKSNETDLDEILDQFIKKAQAARQSSDEDDYDDVSIPGFD